MAKLSSLNRNEMIEEGTQEQQKGKIYNVNNKNIYRQIHFTSTVFYI